MKSILVLIGGSDRDEVVLQTALAAARPFSAHLNFLHIHVSPEQAARQDRHVDFAMGAALRNTLDELEVKAKSFSELAADNVRNFCACSMIEICDVPTDAQKVTASFREEKDNALARLIFHARHHDLIVMGRGKQTQGLPPDILERLVLSSGRPMLVAGSAAPQKFTGTVMVCWKECGNAPRRRGRHTPTDQGETGRVRECQGTRRRSDRGLRSARPAVHLEWGIDRSASHPSERSWNCEFAVRCCRGLWRRSDGARRLRPFARARTTFR